MRSPGSRPESARVELIRKKVADAEKRLRRLQEAIEAGANPVALVDPLNRAQDERDAALSELERLPAAREFTRAEIDAMIDYLGDVGVELNRADPAKLRDLYEALKVEMTYDADRRTVDVTIRPAGRGGACVRGLTDQLAELRRVERLESVNCHHNLTEQETHFGKQVWLSRKVRSRPGRDSRV